MWSKTIKQIKQKAMDSSPFKRVDFYFEGIGIEDHLVETMPQLNDQLILRAEGVFYVHSVDIVNLKVVCKREPYLGPGSKWEVPK